MSFGSRTRMRSITTAPMSNENEIGNDDADELWVENDGVDDLGGAKLDGAYGVGCDLALSLSLSL